MGVRLDRLPSRHAWWVWFALAAFASHAARAVDSVSTEVTVGPQAVDRDAGGDRAEHVFNLRTMYGLSVGVSSYGKKAKPDFDTKPAHALSAALIVDTLDRTYQAKFEPGDHRRLLTELRLPAGAIGNSALLDEMAQSVGVEAIANPRFSPFGPELMSNRDGSFPYFGDNRLISRQKIEDEVRRALQDMAAGAGGDDVRTALFYFSAHGTLGSDGALYLIPADATARDPSTWLKVDDLLAPIYAFAAEGGNPGMKRRILAIVDICQKGGATAAAALAPPPRGVAVIQSSSPGQYAWHFRTATTIANHQSTSPGSPSSEQVDANSTMSFLPISIRRSFRVLGASLSPLRSGTSPDASQRRNITVGEFFEATKSEMDKLAAADLAVQRSGGQTASILYGEGAKAMNFLTLVNAGDLFEVPVSKRQGRVYADLP